MAKTKTRRAAKPAQIRDLAEDDIVSAAIAMIRQKGFAGVSMRQLAADLQVTPPALYHHVKDKTELLDRAADHLNASFPMPDVSLPWDQRLTTLLIDFQTVFGQHPGLAAHAARRMHSPATLRWIEMVLSVLLAAGFRGEAAMRALHVVGFYNNPATLRDVSRAQARAWDAMDPAALERVLKKARGRYASVEKMQPNYRNADEADFRFGLNLLIEGLKHQLALQSRGRTKRT
jgi:AcrR family transcriptional regulator